MSTVAINVCRSRRLMELSVKKIIEENILSINERILEIDLPPKQKSFIERSIQNIISPISIRCNLSHDPLNRESFDIYILVRR